MNEQLKQRLVGAAVLVLLAVIFVPMILDRPSEPEVRIQHPILPLKPETEFTSRIVPLSEPAPSPIETESITGALVESEPAQPTEPVETKEDLAAADSEAEPDAPPEPAPKTAEVAPAPAAWAIQLGSFSSPKNAMELRDKLKKKGYIAFIETARVGGKEITRVFVGPELAKERAGELVKKLQTETELKGMIVQYPGS